MIEKTKSLLPMKWIQQCIFEFIQLNRILLIKLKIYLFKFKFIGNKKITNLLIKSGAHLDQPDAKGKVKLFSILTFNCIYLFLTHYFVVYLK